jgi:AraC-like DNA-binding protein
MSSNKKIKTDTLDSAMESLAASVDKWTQGHELFETGIPGLLMSQVNKVTKLAACLHEPSICFTVRGAKNVILGDESYTYDSRHFLIASMDLPVLINVIDAPYLGILLKFDLNVVSQLITDNNLPSYPRQQTTRSMSTTEISLPLIKSFHRLIDLLDEPESIPILAPMIKREIYYRLLMSEQGPNLRQRAGSQTIQIAHAIEWLKQNYKKSLNMKELASRVNMSKSSFYQHFRSLTAMSPLQYQKTLRLHEARRRMLSEHQDATTTAFAVGYESSSQFSREYSRLFGLPPSKDIKRLQLNTSHKR